MFILFSSTKGSFEQCYEYHDAYQEQTSRGAILVYLLFQATASCPDITTDTYLAAIDPMKE